MDTDLLKLIRVYTCLFAAKILKIACFFWFCVKPVKTLAESEKKVIIRLGLSINAAEAHGNLNDNSEIAAHADFRGFISSASARANRRARRPPRRLKR